MYYFGNGINIGPSGNTGPNKGQIQFPATQNASSGANVLDDYEEGTWTPTDASGAGLSITSSNCYYTKVGRNVTLTWGSITWPSTASGAQAVIGGLPFTSKSGGTWHSGGVPGYTDYTSASFLMGANATTLTGYKVPGGTLTNANMSTLNWYGGSFTYITG